MQNYSKKFFLKRKKATQDSAKIILDILFSAMRPCSVIDVGCGTGTWLAESKNQGAQNVFGVDGHWVVRGGLLEIRNDEFSEHDLNASQYVPSGKYDLALCIEVAEHLSEAMGVELVETLTMASEAVLFSAAVCGQGGTGHLNEQPQHFWADKFAAHDYVCIDLVRPEIWNNEAVNVIYKQNMFLYMSRKRCVELGHESKVISSNFDLDRVHPDLLSLRANDRLGNRRSHLLRGVKHLWRAAGI